ncbi:MULTISPECIES: LysR family transcriptional regulator [Ensifer]|jgi:DNA-binding transcriptional LysR family regulator|uniref:LysR family transcriptional regulator n=1 Tax=Ensifer canadensis TaxID=555315 RepID=A0AAW4FE48_9HYPH|nr:MULTISPECIES: LysR family transcriptional regulator [Ensifer]AHK46894.1 putative LysR, transcriptional regulator [Ensifer adhaerens OV14]MDP9629220.1 DNA-binding transcriptional LysR family regulator [Ensifer adhaerens]KQU90588.1 transcriptional regulator [Ensifer sp. Root31]KQW50374.1 transcriptional regulator [Ensifer sp. Root1252]KQW67336.1 transcriptional regulator [Ensifer sp. Root127]
MNITLRQLRAFIAVAELGQFNIAARNLHLTQSAVSILIRDLESEIGVRLFDRHTRMVSLTLVGQEFLPQARKILKDLELAVGDVRDNASLKRGQVTVAAAIVLAATIVPPIIARFLRMYPEISVSIRDMPEEAISPALKRNEVDIAVGTLSEEDPEITATPLLRDKLMLVCREDHRFAKRKSVRWEEMKDESLITLAAANPLRSIVEHNLIRVAPNFRPKYEVRFSTTAISMIAAGMGVAVLPENSSQLASAVHVTTIDLIEPDVMRDVSLLQRRQHSLSPAAEHLKAAFVAWAADRTGSSVRD